MLSIELALHIQHAAIQLRRCLQQLDGGLVLDRAQRYEISRRQSCMSIIISAGMIKKTGKNLLACIHDNMHQGEVARGRHSKVK